MGKPYGYRRVMVGLGAGIDPKTIDSAGTTGQVLTMVTTGSEPAFAAPATVNLTSGVTGVLPVANGGTGQTVGAVALLQFSGAAVAAGATVFLGHGANATEAIVAFPCPVAGTIIAASAACSTGPVGAETFSYRIRVAAGNVGTVMTITGAAVLVVAAQTVAVTLGQLVTVRLITSAGAAVASHTATLALRVDG